jgi:opacity protein-like surface antigen
MAMKRYLIVFVLFAFCVPAFALIPKPYIGVNLQSNSPTGDFKGTNLEDDQGGAKSGIGYEIDLGINSSMESAYVGYRTGKFDAKSSGELMGEEITAEGEWKVDRWVIGARWHVLGGLPTPIVPTLGGGVTIGKTNANASGSGFGQDESVDENSKSSMGWFLEGGVIVRAIGNLSLIGDVQYHRFESEFENEFYDGPITVSFFTLQVGARFMLL